MSTESITVLEEEARELVEAYFLGTVQEAIVNLMIENGDYQQLRFEIKTMRDMIFDLEYNPNDTF